MSRPRWRRARHVSRRGTCQRSPGACAARATPFPGPCPSPRPAKPWASPRDSPGGPAPPSAGVAATSLSAASQETGDPQLTGSCLGDGGAAHCPLSCGPSEAAGLSALPALSLPSSGPQRDRWPGLGLPHRCSQSCCPLTNGRPLSLPKSEGGAHLNGIERQNRSFPLSIHGWLTPPRHRCPLGVPLGF